MRSALTFFVAVGLCGVWGSVWGQEANQTGNAVGGAAESLPAVPDNAVAGAPQQLEPGFLVRLEINHQTASYREGDNLSVKAVSEASRS